MSPPLNRITSDERLPAQVDVVVTLGFAASHLVAHRAQLPKPTIAASILDPVLQALSSKAGTSGRHNFTYITGFNRVEDQVETFHRTIGFSHLVVLVDPLALQVVPELQTKATELQAATGASVVLRATRAVSRASACSARVLRSLMDVPSICKP